MNVANRVRVIGLGSEMLNMYLSYKKFKGDIVCTGTLGFGLGLG
jgi:hypothetical protein